MPKIYIPTPLRPLSSGQSMLQLPGTDVASLLEALDSQCPGIKAQLYDQQGKLKRHIALFVNDTDIRELQGLETPLGERDEVHLIPAIAGGSH